MAELTTNINYLQPTSFKLLIDRKNYPNLEFFCQSVSHPSMSIGGPEIPFRDVRTVPFAGDKFVFTELNVNVIIDEDMNAYQEMYDWMRRIVEVQNATGFDRLTGEIPAAADLTLNILSSHNNVTKQIRYIDAIPSSIGSVELESTSAGTEFLVFTASFRFSYFDLV